MAHRRGKVLVCALALAGAIGYAVVQRARSWAEGEGQLADGSAQRLELGAPGLRHIAWDRPQALGGATAAPGGEQRPALSPDGRWLAFASGERGLNCDLYLCEIVGGVPGEPRRIAALDGPSDELAPAFSAHYLYFASDRAGGAGGLDLYRARFEGGRCDAPEHLDSSLQSEADDSDPAPALDDATLVFASERAHGMHLWQAQLDGRGTPFDAPVELDALATESGEREPALARDGRTLTFVAARDGRLDLFQSLFARDAWQPARALVLPGPPCERRGPCLSANGFELWFAQALPGEPAHLARAASIELYAIPPIAWTWYDSAVVGSLLLLAASALLALRWTGLGLAYRCVLASVIAHLVLLFLLRFILIGGGEGPAQGEQGAPPSAPQDFQITFRSSPSAAPGRERAGTLENVDGLAAQAAPAPAPDAFAPQEGRANAPEVAGLASSPEPEAPSAPERGGTAREPELAPVVTSVALEAPSFAPARHVAAAPSLALDSITSAESSGAPAAGGPGRASLATPGSAAAPSAGAALVQAPAAAELPAPGRGTSASPRAGEPSSVSVALAAPSDARPAAIGGRAPELALGSAVLAESQPAGVGGPGRAPLAPSGSGSAEHAQPSPTGALVALGNADDAAAPARAASGAAPGEGAQSGALSPVALAAPRSEGKLPGAGSGASAAPGLALEPAAATGSADAGASGSGPARAALAAGDGSPKPGAPAPGPLRLGGAASETQEPAAPSRGALAGPAPAQSRGPTVALADHSQVSGPLHKSGGGSSEPDLVSDLGSGSGGSVGAREASAPSRVEFGAPHEHEPAADGPPRDSLVRAPETPRESEPRVERKSWDNSPYENRSGEQKARALELHGGNEHTEQAVARGLEYLARIQQRGGNWGRLEGFDQKYGQVAAGKTGLCLLAFLGAGHTQGSGTQHSAVVARAVDALLALQDPQTGHFGRSDAYGHGIATYALAEDLAMTGDARVRAALEPAVRHILEEQDTHSDPRLSGGWSYYFPDGHVFDRWPRTAITSWQVMALESARLSGIRVPDAAFEGARRFLENAHDEEQGNWRYNHDPQRLNSDYATLPASTPAAMFALALLGDDLAGAEYAPARGFVLARAPDGYRFSGEDAFVQRGAGNLYFWYYGTLAMFRAGGKDWERWNEAMKLTLLPAQNRDGSWEPIDPYARYAQDSGSDKSFTSALCVLSLEVYYRYYLPLLKVR